MAQRFCYETRPVAAAQNVVSGKNYRFTVLTSKLIRLEFSVDGAFEDRASQSVFFRDFPQTDFKVNCSGGNLVIETENLVLTYKENEPFSEDTLNIKLKCEPATSWRFGEKFETLGGTTKTLDEAHGRVPLEHGVCSANGFSVLDDSDSMLLNEEGWVELRKPNTKDVYFFGYGFEYLNAVKDFYRLTGAPPLLPAYALGNWWSRYHKYTQNEYEELVCRFEREDIPFSVGVVDMDWHITKIPEHLQDKENRHFTDGWTGYTWNEELFPDYRAFLKFLKEHNLKTALNLHPASGVCQHEAQYEQMAKACGIDPESKKRVPFDVLSRNFMENYFDILHHPYEEDGVDFWWMDWQQGTTYWWIHEENKNGVLKDEREVLDPLWMINHLHIADIKRNGKRPMFFSRYSGPGSQRYPVGFSGDSFVSWESLDFQPYFTATSSNIGYSWWSHDIGGHGDCYRDDELMARWVQLGVFSPINRLHSTDNEFIRKEPWCFKASTQNVLADSLRLRHSLFPYIYTMNYRNHTELEPLVQPMYYNYPKCFAAYEAKNQFMFGSELMVASITSPNNKITDLGKVDVWLPKGEWFDFFKGLNYSASASRNITVHRKLNEYPVFAKAGAIVPMQKGSRLEPQENMQIVIFPGADNNFTLYEDEGDGNAYENGRFSKTEMKLEWGKEAIFTLACAKGDTSLIPAKRNWELSFRGFNKNTSLRVTIDGKETSVNTEYEKETNSIIVQVAASIDEEINVVLSGEKLVTDNCGIKERCLDILQKSQCDVKTKINTLNAIDGILAKKDIPFINVRSKLCHACLNSPEMDGLYSALIEQLTLKEG